MQSPRKLAQARSRLGRALRRRPTSPLVGRCESLNSYLQNPVAHGVEDKRMEIDLEGLREYLWEYTDGTPKDYITEDQHDKVRWIDTSTMICDPLTKAGGKGFDACLQDCVMTGKLDVEQTVEIKLKKRITQKQRNKKRLN